jgi:hypothetical protein
MSAFVMQLHRMALLTVLALALVATGFAHRLPNADEQIVAAMAAAGASVADICGDLGQPGRHADSACEACQIVGGAGLPLPTGAVLPAELVLLAAVLAPRESRRAVRVLDLSRTPQAPPLA